MGYYSDVRIATTKEGFEKIKQLVPKIYEENLKALVEEAKKDKKEIKQDKNTVTIDHAIYSKHTDLMEDPTLVLATSKDGKYVIFGWDGLKWQGYMHMERKSYEKAFEMCGEPVRSVSIGEDEVSECLQWGEDDYDMPYLEVVTQFDYEDKWEFNK